MLLIIYPIKSSKNIKKSKEKERICLKLCKTLRKAHNYTKIRQVATTSIIPSNAWTFHVASLSMAQHVQYYLIKKLFSRDVMVKNQIKGFRIIPRKKLVRKDFHNAERSIS